MFRFMQPSCAAQPQHPSSPNGVTDQYDHFHAATCNMRYMPVRLTTIPGTGIPRGGITPRNMFLRKR